MTIEPLEVSDVPVPLPIQRGKAGHRRVVYSVGSAPESLSRQCIVVAGAATAIVEALAAALAGHAGLEVVSTALSEAELFELVGRRRVDAVVLYVPDLDPETMGSVNRLRMHDPVVRIVVLTADATPRTLAQAAGAGVAACLSLHARMRDLAEAIRAETTETMLVDAASLSAQAVTRVNETNEGGVSLTRRELEVVAMLADGCSPPVIAAELVISIYTARGHVKSVLRKLGVHSQLEAVATARRLGLLEAVPAAERSGSDVPGPKRVTPIVAAGDARLVRWRNHG